MAVVFIASALYLLSRRDEKAAEVELTLAA